MNKFWEWMEKKNYYHDTEDIGYGQFPYIECECIKIPCGMDIDRLSNKC